METPPEEKPAQSMMNKPLSERGIGVLALIGCGVLSYLSIVGPLVAASRHEESVNFSMKGAVVAPVLLAIGVINVAMGDRSSRILGRREKPSALGWVIYAVTFGLGVLLYQWLKSKLRHVRLWSLMLISRRLGNFNLGDVGSIAAEIGVTDVPGFDGGNFAAAEQAERILRCGFIPIKSRPPRTKRPLSAN